MEITLDSIKKVVEEFQNTQIDSELDILLSDNDPAKLSLMHGGKLIEIDGKYYVISADYLKGFFTNVPNCFKS